MIPRQSPLRNGVKKLGLCYYLVPLALFLSFFFLTQNENNTDLSPERAVRNKTFIIHSFGMFLSFFQVLSQPL